jgi:hypothetical protein
MNEGSSNGFTNPGEQFEFDKSWNSAIPEVNRH